MADYIRWQTIQGGFHKHDHAQTLDNIPVLLTKARPVSWDGTYSMPILPVTNNAHRDMKNIYGVPL